MSFLDDVVDDIESAAKAVKEGKSAIDSFRQNGTDPRAPSVVAQVNRAEGISTITWVLIGLGAAVILYMVVKK